MASNAHATRRPALPVPDALRPVSARRRRSLARALPTPFLHLAHHDDPPSLHLVLPHHLKGVNVTGSHAPFSPPTGPRAALHCLPPFLLSKHGHQEAATSPESCRSTVATTFFGERRLQAYFGWTEFPLTSPFAMWYCRTSPRTPPATRAHTSPSNAASRSRYYHSADSPPHGKPPPPHTLLGATTL
jgi:hypothetical protein